ncbi:hypothetical protein [Sulfoacidibacillus thermotolerans]|nr:hypothetical protein [Sulfoacidibacillus thermotolerans]
MSPSPIPGFLFLVIGWLGFTWVPGWFHSRRFDRGNAEMEEIIRDAEKRE